MKVCVLSVQVPFITGGAELMAAALQTELVRRGCEAEIVTVPFKWYPPERLLDCMMMARLIDLSEVNGSRIDRVIALKFPAYFASHPRHVCWIMHQHRQAYDLYGTPMSDLCATAEGRAVAAEIRRWDEHFLPQSGALFTISKNVADRLQRFNSITATPLYHPPFNQAVFRTGRADPYVLYPGRFDAVKRQHLLFEALAHLPKNIDLVFCGQTDSAYGAELLQKIARSEWSSRVRVLGRISEQEKIELYANCLAVYNGVYDEDYGYVTLEAFSAGKPVITHFDSGGPLEFIVDGSNGYVTDSDAPELAATIAKLAAAPERARQMGAAGRETLRVMNISWDHVIDSLLAA